MCGQEQQVQDSGSFPSDGSLLQKVALNGSHVPSFQAFDAQAGNRVYNCCCNGQACREMGS